MTNQTKQDIYSFAEQHYNPDVVAIDREAIKSLQLPVGELSLIPSFLPEPVRSTPIHGIAFLLALNTINYMFWSLESTDGATRLARYAFDGKEGAMGMRAAFDRFWDSVGTTYSPPVLTEADIIQHFGDMPDAAGRAESLNAVLANGAVHKHAGRLYEKILATKSVDADDAAELERTFPAAYADPFCKRSQLALAMVAGFMGECGVDVDTSGLTLFADYQVPRSLRAMGILKFSPGLAAKIETHTLIPEGPGDEYAICAAVILCGRAMSEHFGVPEAVLDNFLWQYRKQAGALPFHLSNQRRY